GWMPCCLSWGNSRSMSCCSAWASARSLSSHPWPPTAPTWRSRPGRAGRRATLAGGCFCRGWSRAGSAWGWMGSGGRRDPWLLKDMDRNLSQLPNIAYAWTTEQLHDGGAWLSEELDRRGDVAFAGMDTRGRVHANVGPRQFTMAEELNLAVPRLKQYWGQ